MPAPTTLFQPYAHRFPGGFCKDGPTAAEVVKDAGVTGKWANKVIIITGATAGIGIETAKALHATGAKLYLTMRDLKKAEGVVKDILSSSESKTPIELLKMDLSSLKSVRSAAEEFLSKEKKLNILINNAGIMATPYSKTEDGFESQIGTNHFGHFLFFQLLKPTLLASSTPSFQSRVVSLSSAGHGSRPIQFDDIFFERNKYSPFAAYGQSKTANIYLANSIERYYGSQGLHAFSVHPGVIFDTELTRSMTPELLGAVTAALDKVAHVVKTREQGAATSVWAAVSPDLEGKGGVYLADVGVSGPGFTVETMGGPEYAEHAYNEEAEEKLWKLSYELVGVAE